MRPESIELHNFVEIKNLKFQFLTLRLVDADYSNHKPQKPRSRAMWGRGKKKRNDNEKSNVGFWGAQGLCSPENRFQFRAKNHPSSGNSSSLMRLKEQEEKVSISPAIVKHRRRSHEVIFSIFGNFAIRSAWIEVNNKSHAGYEIIFYLLQ